MGPFIAKARENHEQRRAHLKAQAASKDAVISDLVDALKETLEIASRNEAGPYIRRALNALHNATTPEP